MTIHHCVNNRCSHTKVTYQKTSQLVCKRLVDFLSIPDGDVSLLDGDAAAILGEILCLPSDIMLCGEDAEIATEDHGLINYIAGSDEYALRIAPDPKTVDLECIACAKIAGLFSACITSWAPLTILENESTDRPLFSWETATGTGADKQDAARARVFASVMVGILFRYRETALGFISYMLKRRQDRGLDMEPLSYKPATETDDDEMPQIKVIRQHLASPGESPIWLVELIQCAPAKLCETRSLEWQESVENAEWRRDAHYVKSAAPTRDCIKALKEGRITETAFREEIAKTQCCLCGVPWYTYEVRAVGDGSECEDNGHEMIFCCLSHVLAMNSGCRLVVSPLVALPPPTLLTIDK